MVSQHSFTAVHAMSHGKPKQKNVDIIKGDAQSAGSPLVLDALIGGARAIWDG